MTQPAEDKAYGALSFRSLIKLWPWLRPNRRLVFIGASVMPIVGVIAMIQPIAIQRAIDEGILKGDIRITIGWALAGLLLSLAHYVFAGIQSLTTATAVHKMIRDLRTTLVGHVLNLSPAWHDHQISGALATRATSDFDTLSESLNQGVLSSVIDLMVLVGCVVGMFVLSPQLAIIAVVILPIITWIVIWFSKKLNTSMLVSRKNLAALNGFAQEALTSLSAVKLLNAEYGVSRRFARLNRQYRDAQLENVYYDALMFSTIDGIASITLGIVLFMTIKSTGLVAGTTLEATLTAGTMVAFVQYVQQLFEPLKMLGTKMAMLQGAFTSIQRIFGLLDRRDIVPGDQGVSWPSAVSIQFDDVSFRYHSTGSDVLRSVSFTINPGTSLAIIGSTGSGKSTIVKLISKLYYGYSGRILVNHESISPLNPEDVRAQIGIVPQDIVLFEGSILFNIGLGKPHVTERDIKEACRTVGADQFIEQLPGQYHYIVREHGDNLSHGQKQLIVFARALLGKPPVLILDEATSSIDPQSESLIQEATQKLLAGRTVIVIAHRLETIKRCHQVLVLEHGQVIEHGTPEELTAKQGRYDQLTKLSKVRNTINAAPVV
jgi:ATP-binding cassette subfamily B multidrug efflux pump